jgi:hypothetical protein
VVPQIKTTRAYKAALVGVKDEEGADIIKINIKTE